MHHFISPTNLKLIHNKDRSKAPTLLYMPQEHDIWDAVLTTNILHAYLSCQLPKPIQSAPLLSDITQQNIIIMKGVKYLLFKEI